MSPPASLAAVLRKRAAGPDAMGLRFLFVGDDVPPGYTPEGPDRRIDLRHRDVLDLAQRAAGRLRAAGAGPGDRVLLILPTGPGFAAAFHGCQLLSAVPVPVVPPWSPDRLEEHVERIARIAAIAAPAVLVTTGEIATLLRGTRDRHPALAGALANLVVVEELWAEPAAATAPEPCEGQVPALIQFTSGSTGDPKGVVISQRALLANARAIAAAGAFGAGDAALTWLPLFHDMGLVGHFVTPLVAGIPAILLPPEVFVRRPVDWLAAVGHYRATITTAPNFAYQICVRRIAERDLAGLDLSTLRIAMCGGEPVHAKTLAAFAERFAPVGLRAAALFPVYGLAELTLAATFPPPGRGPRVDVVAREPFVAEGLARPAAPSGAPEATLSFVSVGSPMPGHAVRIVDASGASLPDRQEGEIELSGPSRMDGYFDDDAATAGALRDGWLRTGDLGYLAGGELHVSGRRKEVAVIRGRNVYPQDVERAAETVEGVRAGRSAAFGVPAADQGTEALILICELPPAARADPAEELRVLTGIRRAVLSATGVTPDRVVLADPGTIPKTSSGKTQRALARARYLALTEPAR